MQTSDWPAVLIERVSRVAALGVRFWDELTRAVVSDGLVVTAYPEGEPARGVPATPSSLGIHAFPHLPGLRDVEGGAGYADYRDSLPRRQRYVVEVVDPWGRFQPFQFGADAPTRGLFAWVCGSPATSSLSVPLFSTPRRRIPAAMAVVRAELWDPLAGAPAAWAVLQARAADQPAVRGVADAAGRVALIFSYPEPVGRPLGSPGGAAGVPLTQQTWPLELAAFYSPRQPVPTLPDLCTTLSQPAAALWADAARSERLGTASLAFGRELVLRSRDVVTRPPLPQLLITPAGSPP